MAALFCSGKEGMYRIQDRSLAAACAAYVETYKVFRLPRFRAARRKLFP